MQGIMKRTTTSESLYRLIYRSRSAIAQVAPDVATESDLRREVQAMVSAARERNKAADVTGAMLFSDGGFIQVLEGPREVVDRAFDRISEDPRHAEVTVLSFTPAQRRCFPDLPLGFCGLSPGSLPATGRRPTTGSEILRLLERMVQQEDTWIDADDAAAEVNPVPESQAPGR
jgi:hypothetical protein